MYLRPEHRATLAFAHTGNSPQAAATSLRSVLPGERPRLGILPFGTGNSFVREFSDRGAEYAIEALLADKRRACDVVRVTYASGVMHFLTMLAIGFVADVGATRNQHFSAFGEFGYTLSTLMRLRSLHPYIFPIRLAERESFNREPTIFIAINNGRFTGGRMIMAPSASLQDGLLDVITVASLGRIELLRTFPKIFTGAHIGHSAVTYEQTSAADFDIDGVLDVLIDGEIMRINPMRVEVVPGAIDVVA